MIHVRDIMSTELITVSPQLSLRDLVDLLAKEHLGGAPVVSAGHAVGVVTLDDVAAFLASQPVVPTEGAEELVFDVETADEFEAEGDAASAFFLDTWADVGADVAERFADERSPEWDLLGEHTVEEVMSRRLWTVTPGDRVDQAARRMTEAGVHRLLVVENGHPCGIVSTSDITRAVAEGLVHQ